MKQNIRKSLICVMMAIQLVSSQLGFPEVVDISKNKANLQGRLPLFSPGRCKDYELLYPGDQKNDWICDCAPAAIYHPDTDACYPAFHRGPCEAEEILILPDEKIIPACVPNDCKVDGRIKVRGGCYDFGENGPCQTTATESYVIGVDPKTLHVDCIRLSIENRFASEAVKDSCTNRGSKKFLKGDCMNQK
ncbi:uncharacterized protein ACN427_007253 [Glossina fuscipes fuscipes]